MKAAILQSAAHGLTVTQRLDLLSDTAETADADMLVCPELFLSGYAAGEEITQLAEAADGPSFDRIAEIATTTDTAIVYGYPERAKGTLYNAAQCVGPDGSSLANHRKLILPPGFESTYFQPGQGLTLFDFGGLKFGLVICYDVEFPETVRANALAGAQVVLAPTALAAQWGVVAERVVPARAFENGVYVLYANHCGTEGELSYLGASAIIAPDGTDLARAGGEREIVSSMLDPARVRAAQDRLPYHRDLTDLKARL